MKTNRSIYMTILLLCLGYFAVAQNSTTTLTPGYWTFGLNAGLAYQSSDVKSTLDGFGFGATLGKNVFYRPGAPLAFDLRGRFLYTRQYGLDPLRSYDIANNQALNGANLLDYTSYPVEFEEPRGFVYHNHKTNTAELSLEGLLTLNQLRERTGIHVGLFGGIGLDWFKTRTDQADINGNEYFAGYDNIDENRSNSVIRNELRRLLDGDYETIADGNSEDGTLKFMPSLGLELGYQLSPNFLVYGGHRVTFSGTDALDGVRSSSLDNDLYHYTNLGLRWTINTTREKDIARAPEIEIVTPLGSPYTTSSVNGLVVASIRYINSAADVNCIVNSRSVNFSYNNGRFSVDTPLRPGTNEVIITAQNPHGQARRTVLLVYREAIIETPRMEAPRVRITDPGYNNFRTEAEDFTVRAAIENVTDYRDIRFEVNGIARDFIFENGNLRANIPLREGNNRVQIRATNAAGSDEAETNITRASRIQRPIVDITDPAGSRVESAYRNVRITAQVRNVERSDQIQVLVNNRRSYSFDFDVNKGFITFDADLNNGNNDVIIIATNPAGEARDAVTIIYREPLSEPVRPPSVRITEPSRSAVTTTEARARIEAIVTNVSSRSDITFSVNGRRSNDFNFDTRNGRLTANVNLLPGNNDVLIRAENRDGQDQQSVAIRRLEEIVVQNPPIVRIYAPRNNSETDRTVANLDAAIEYVNDPRDINLLVNGRSISNFNFNRSSGRLTANITLQDGNNTIRIRATNRDGVDDETVNIRYRRIDLPTVRISTPANNATTDRSTVQVRANVSNINSRNQISLLVNGRRTDFNFDSNRNEISANVNLQEEGGNTIRVEAQNEAGTASDAVNVTFRRAAPPTVRIAAPANNSTTESAGTTLRATVTNINGSRNITVTLNGNRVTNFSFNGSDLTADLNLQEGSNTANVAVSNDDGRAEASVNIRYEPQRRPAITITDPARAPHTISEDSYLVRAKVQNVDNQNDLTVLVNSQKTRLFNFDRSSGDLVVRAISLREGNNAVVIRAQNAGGSAEASTTLLYRLPQPPTVQITEPADGATTNTEKAIIRAKITRVSNPRNVTFTVNGKSVQAFELRGEDFTATVALQAGKNTIGIRVQNEDGSTEDVTELTYELRSAQFLTPSVKFSEPAKPGIVVKKSIFEVKADLINVGSAREITMWLNGKTWKDFSYNARSRKLTAKISLQNGKNTVRIAVQNKGGKAEAETNIVAEMGDKPVITIESISQPTVNPFRPQIANSTVIAKIDHISDENSVKILVNGSKIDDFSYNIMSKKLQATVQLQRGDNEIVIRASNQSGTTEEKRTITF